MSIFTKTKDLVAKIDEFIDQTSNVALHFKEAIYLFTSERMKEFEERSLKIHEIEVRADTLKRDIESKLYSETLIPESRGDVLGIIEGMDGLIDWSKSTIQEFSIEKPEIPEKLNESIVELTHQVYLTVDALTSSVRSYFYNINEVKNYDNKVHFYESEADSVAERVRRDLFAMDIDLSKKIHLRYFISRIDILADKAEDLVDRIAISTIKRIV